MVIEYTTEPLKIGTYVKIRNSGFDRAVISEFRGLFGRERARIYGVYGYDDPNAPYLEVSEDQIEALPPDPPVTPPAA